MCCKKRKAIEKKGIGKRKYAAVRRQAATLAAGILFAGFCAVLPLQAEEEARPGSSPYVQGEESVSDNDAQSEPPQEDTPNSNDGNPSNPETSQPENQGPTDQNMQPEDRPSENTPNPEQKPRDSQDSNLPKQKAKNKPTITSQPEDARVEAGDCAYFNVSAVGKNLSYQWYVDKGDGIGFRQVNGANEALYRVMVFDGSMNDYIYKCRVKSNPDQEQAGRQETGEQENNIGSNSDGKQLSDKEDSEKPDENYVESRAAKLTIFYKIVGGARGVWVKSSGRGLIFQGSGPYSRFSGVNVDGSRIGAEGFNKGGSQTPFTEVTLLRSYLETLAEGEHELELVWTDGAAKTSFRIEAPSADLSAAATGLGRTGSETEGSSRAAGKTSAVRDAAAAAVMENGRDEEKSSPADRGRGGENDAARISGNTTEASASEHTGSPSQGTAADVLSSAGIFADGQGEAMTVTRGERRTQAHADYERSPVWLAAMAGTKNRYAWTICMAVTLISTAGIAVGLFVYRLHDTERETKTCLCESRQNREESDVEMKGRNEG